MVNVGVGPQATHVRYLILLLASLMSVVLYLDRFCLGFFLTYIREDLRLSADQSGLLLSAFFWSYALGQVPAGWLSDRWGARSVLACYILLWSLFTGLMGLADSLWLLIVLRLGFGFAQAGAYPTGAALLSRWAPFQVRASYSAIIATGGRCGAFLAPILTVLLLITFVPRSQSSLLEPADILDVHQLHKEWQASAWPVDWPAGAVQMSRAELAGVLNGVLKLPDLYDRVNWRELALPAEAVGLAELPAEQLTESDITRRNRLLLEAAMPLSIRKIYGRGWRPAVYVYGSAGVIIAGLFWLGVRNRPGEHPLCNAAEQSLIEAGKPSIAQGRAGGLPLGHILRSRSLWCSSLSQFGTNFGWVFLGTWLPEYLARVHHVPIEERGWMTSIPWLIGMAGMLGGGWLTDRLTRVLGLRWGRRLPMASTRFIAMAAYLACMVLESPWLITAAFCVMAVATDLGTSAVWAFKQDVGGRHVGSVLGWGNMWGNLGAAIAPLALGAIISMPGVDDPVRWDLAFAACAFAFFIAGIAALGVDATVPIVPENHPAA